MAGQLTDVLEISEMIVDAGRPALDTGLLIHMMRYNGYCCVEDATEDQVIPRRIKVQLHIYVEDLD